jgi:hypothetical protein
MAYLDSESTSYLAWSWNAGASGCGSPKLITDYQGDATAYGIGYKEHLQSLGQRYASTQICLCDCTTGFAVIAQRAEAAPPAVLALDPQVEQLEQRGIMSGIRPV